MPAVATDISPESASDAEKAASETPNFSFRFQDRNFRAWTEDGPGGPTVCLACDIGHLPYSAENREGRRAGLMILSAAGSVLSSRLLLTDFHKISLLTTASISDVEDLKSVVATAATSVLGCMPLIELMESSLAPIESSLAPIESSLAPNAS